MKNHNLRILCTFLEKGKTLPEKLKLLDFEIINIW